MKFSKEVEAVARTLYEREMARASNTQSVLEGAAGRPLPGAAERETFEEHADQVWYPDAIAVLEAAIAARRSDLGQSP